MRKNLSTILAMLSLFCFVVVFFVPTLANMAIINFALIAIMSLTAIVFFTDGVKYKMPEKFIYGACWTALLIMHLIIIFN